MRIDWMKWLVVAVFFTALVVVAIMVAALLSALSTPAYGQQQTKSVIKLLRQDMTLTTSDARWIVSFLKLWDEYAFWCREHPDTVHTRVITYVETNGSTNYAPDQIQFVDRHPDTADFVVWLKRKVGRPGPGASQ